MTSTAGQVIKCKAAVAWKAREPLVIEEVEVAPPQTMEVRIKILFTSLCHIDIHFWKDKGQKQIFPTIFGHEAGGIVESIGKGVIDLAPGDHVLLDFARECKQCMTDLSPGDNVLPNFTGNCKECPHCNLKNLLRINRYKGVMISDGQSRFSINGKPIYHFVGTSTFSEYTVVHVGYVAKINPEAPLDKVCILSCGISTGLGVALNIENLPEDSTVAIFGLGDVGLAAAEGARIAGASRIIGIDINHKRFNKGEFGFTDFMNPIDYLCPVQKKLVLWTKGGVDLSIECTGNICSMISAFEGTRYGNGVAVLVGVLNKDDAFQTHSFRILKKRILKRTFFGDNKRRFDLHSLVEKYMSKKLELEKFITHEVPFSEINKAFDYMFHEDSIRCIIHMDA